MDWTSTIKQGKLRIALLEIYSGEDSKQRLRQFVRDSFGHIDNDLIKALLSRVEGNSAEAWAGSLIEKFGEHSLIPELYKKVCQEYEEHPAIQELQLTLKGDPLLGERSKVDAEELFANFCPYDDFAIVQKAFLCACREALCDFRKMRPDHPPLTDLVQIQKLIESYQPELAVWFAAHVIVEFQADGRDLTAVTQWRDCIATQHNIPLNSPTAVQEQQQGYLLVALKQNPLRTGDADFVTVFSELHVTDEKELVKFSAETMTCALDEVPKHLSKLIHQAEESLPDRSSGEITLELFLPCEHLDMNVAGWEVLNKKENPRPLGKYRSFVIRSFERAKNTAMQKAVNHKWVFLKNCEKDKDACDRFHPQTTCPAAGDLSLDLRDKPGLKLLAELPSDRGDYLDILDDIIESGVPIALWFSAAEGVSAAEKLTEFDSLLQSCSGDLTDFSRLAARWAQQRKDSPLEAIEHFRLLCDRPDRWPTLPSNQSDPIRAIR
jgi:vWA-MoxR associated protein C-terminal domain